MVWFCHDSWLQNTLFCFPDPPGDSVGDLIFSLPQPEGVSWSVHLILVFCSVNLSSGSPIFFKYNMKPLVWFQDFNVIALFTFQTQYLTSLFLLLHVPNTSGFYQFLAHGPNLWVTLFLLLRTLFFSSFSLFCVRWQMWVLLAITETFLYILNYW